MGYSADIESVDFVIPFENLTEAHRIMCALNEPFKKANAERLAEGRGGFFSPAHFAWMDEDYDEKLMSAQEILDELGFSLVNDFDGGLRITGWQAEKIGDEDEFLEAIAHLVKPESYINWYGEDGESWQYHFDGDKMVRKTGKVTFE